MKTLLFFFFTIVSCNVVFANGSLFELSIDQRISSSSLIVEGEVVAQQSFWNSQHTRIYTSNKIRLTRLLKGEYLENEIYIQTEGGRVGNEMQITSSLLDLKIGEFGIFFCNLSTKDPAPDLPNILYEVYGSRQGFFKYSNNGEKLADPFQLYPASTIEDAIIRHTGAGFTTISTYAFNYPTLRVLNILSFSPSTITAGTKSVLTIKGTDFGVAGPSSVNYVEFPDANYGGSLFYQTDLGDYISWSDTLIQLYVPSRAGTGQFNVVVGNNSIASSSNLTITYSQINATSGTNKYMPYHIDDNGTGGYSWTKSINFTMISHEPAFDRAFYTWKCATGINWEISSNNTSNNASGSDGINVIGMNSSLPAGVLGVCTSYFQSCNGGTEWYVSELDIIFDSGTSWYSGTGVPPSTKVDFESVALHELGHGHLLGHVINSTDVMHYAIGAGQYKRILNYNNITAGNFTMGQSVATNNCGQSPLLINFPGQCGPLAASDGAIYASNPLTNDLCIGNQDVFADLYNFGVDTIFTATIGWSVNNYIRPSFNWTGAIPSGENQFDILIANDYFGDSVQVVKIWVSDVNGIPETNVVNDTATYTFQPFNTPATIQSFTANVPDTICSGQATLVTVTSISGVYYKLVINDSVVVGPTSGGTFNTGPLLQTSPIEVVGYSANQCDTAYYTYYDTIFIPPYPNLPLGAYVKDSILCSGDSTAIVLPNSQIGLEYQLKVNGMLTGPMLLGTGDTLQFISGVVTADEVATFEITNYFGCPYSPADSVFIDINEVISSFTTSKGQYLTTDTIQIFNQSSGDYYQWNFDSGSVSNSDTIYSPLLYYNTDGNKQIELAIRTANGCTDTSRIFIDVYYPIPEGAGSVCFDSTLKAGNSTSGYVTNINYNIIDVHVDEKGNTYAVGTKVGKISYKRTYSYFLWKFNREGDTLLNLEFDGVLSTHWNERQSSFFNSVTVDPYNNIYVGGSFGGFNDINIEGITLYSQDDYMTGFLVKLDSNGVGQWGITLYTPVLREIGVTDVIFKNQNQIYASILGDLVTAEFPDQSTVYLDGDAIVLEVNAQGEYKRHVSGGGPTSAYQNSVIGDYDYNYSTTYYNQITTVSPRMHLTKEGKIYLIGSIAGICHFGDFTIGMYYPYGYQSNYNGFVAVIDSTLQFENAILLHENTDMGDHPGSGSGATSRDRIPAFTFDSKGNLYVAANWKVANPNFSETVSIMDTSFVSVEGAAIFKLNKDLQMEWINFNCYADISSMASTIDDEILFFGDFYNKDVVWFHSQNQQTQAVKGDSSYDIMLGSMDTSGNMNWAREIGTTGVDIAFFMEANGCGDMSMFAKLEDTVYFDSVILESVNNDVVFINYSASGYCNNICYQFDLLQPTDSSYCMQSFIPLYWDNYNITNSDIMVSLDSGNTYQTINSGANISEEYYYLETQDSLYSGRWIIVKAVSQSPVYSDSIWIYVNPIGSVLYLGADTTICVNDSLLIDAGSGYSSFQWNTGDSTQSIFADSTYTYILNALNTYGCLDSDSIHLTVAIQPDILPANSVSCDGPIVINVDGYINYLWSNGDTTSTTMINSPGIYDLNVTDSIGCVYNDSTLVELYTYNDLLPESDTICQGESVLLDAGPGYDFYLWNYWVSNQTYYVATPGVYTVLLEISQCTYNDTVTVIQSSCTSIDEEVDLMQIEVYPNPNNGKFIVSVNSFMNQSYNIQLFDIHSKLIFQKMNALGQKVVELDITQYSKGIYYLRISSDNVSYIRKISKQ